MQTRERGRGQIGFGLLPPQSRQLDAFEVDTDGVEIGEGRDLDWPGRRVGTA